MSDKVRYKVATQELTLNEGEFDETTALGTNQKGKIVQSTGDFIGLGWEEEDDILESAGGLPNTGNFSGAYGKYTQSNIHVNSKLLAGKDGNNYCYHIHRSPNITSSGTWGGISLYPPDDLQRKSGHKFRLSFDYRGYSGGYNLEIYQAYSVGWSTNGINLPRPWSNGNGSFDTDWEWVHVEREFTASDSLLNVIAGAYDWNSTTQYPAGGDYGIRYNGNLYRHRNANPAPTLGVDPDTEYLAGGTYGVDQIYDVRWIGGAAAGYFNVYNQLKIGFGYQAQNARGTHVFVDNITLTDIDGNESYKYDIANETWLTESLTEEGIDVFVKGTAYVAQARTDTGTDIFAVEGSREMEINGVNVSPAGGRGLTLVTFNSAGTVLSNSVYDVYGSSTARDSLATALAGIDSTTFWALSSFDAIGAASNYDAGPNLRNQMIAMGSRMWNPDDTAAYLWQVSAGQVRNPYAAVGKGQKLIKEDGSNALDTMYKRKGVIQTRIS